MTDTLTVYKVGRSYRHQYFLVRKRDDVRALWCDGRPRLATWRPPQVVNFEPKLKKGNFYSFSCDALVADPAAVAALGDVFRACGELLPLPYEGTLYHLVNVTEVSDCMDESQSSPGVEDRYVFIPERVSRSPLFKLSQTPGGSMFCASGPGRVDDFKTLYERSGLSGLVFTPKWSAEVS